MTITAQTPVSTHLRAEGYLEPEPPLNGAEA